MKTSNNESYRTVTDDSGIDFICPIAETADREAPPAGLHEDCIEKDVIERYSGNL